MTEIVTEDDLWKLFSKKPKSHRKKGDGYVLWEALNQVLQAKSFGNGQQALKLNCEDRFYHVVAGANLNEDVRTDAVVRQCDMRRVARSLSGMGGNTLIGYLGMRPQLPTNGD